MGGRAGRGGSGASGGAGAVGGAGGGGSASPERVIELIQRLENSPLFGATALLSSQPPSQNEPLYRYRVSVSYAQKL